MNLVKGSSKKNYRKTMVYSYTILLETPQNKNLEKFHLHSLYKCHKIINSKELFNIIQNGLLLYNFIGNTTEQKP